MFREIAMWLNPIYRRCLIFIVFLAVSVSAIGPAPPVWGAVRTWIGGNNDWNSSNANWTGADEPDNTDDAVFNTANSVNLANVDERVLSLTMSGGISLRTSGNSLQVDGLLQLSGAGTDLTVGGNGSTLNVDTITINSGSDLRIDNGTVMMDESPSNGVLNITAGGTLSGRGQISLIDTPVANGTDLLVNDGTIVARPIGLVTVGLEPTGTLTIDVSDDSNARVDLDGNADNGAVNVQRNQSLVVNAILDDAFNGDMELVQNSTLNIREAWTLDSGAFVTINNGPIDRSPPLLDTPAGVAFIAGGALTQTGGTINLFSDQSTLQFNAPYTLNGGTLTNRGLVIFNANTTIGGGANFNMGFDRASITVNAGVTVNVDQASFDADGNGTGNNVITVQAGGNLDLDLGAGADESLNGIVHLNGGELDVTTSDSNWQFTDGVLNLKHDGGTAAQVNGDALVVGDDVGTQNTDINVTGSGLSRINTAVTFNSDADVNIASGAILRTATTVFQSVNSTRNAEFTGSGTWQLAGNNTFNENTTINMVGGTVDLDNSANTLSLVGTDTALNANLTIRAAAVADYGNGSAAFGVSELTIADAAVLTVNLDSPRRVGPSIRTASSATTAMPPTTRFSMVRTL